MSAKNFVATIASAASTSNGVDLGHSEYFDTVYVNNKAGSEITIQVSNDGTTFGTLFHRGVSTFSTAIVASAASGSWQPVGAAHRYIRAVATGTVANGGSVEFAVAIRR